MGAKDTTRPHALPLGPRMLPLPLDAVAVPEWDAAERAVRASHIHEHPAWTALGACLDLEIYLHASASPRRIDGPIGFAVVAAGFATTVDQGIAQRPAPSAYLEIAGCVAAYPTDTLSMSGNRGYMAALLAALAVLRDLEQDCAAARVTLWSPSAYVVQCANGTRRQQKNIDLWLVYDGLLRALSQRLVDRLSVVRLDAHTYSRYGRVAVRLATGATGDGHAPPRAPRPSATTRIDPAGVPSTRTPAGPPDDAGSEDLATPEVDGHDGEEFIAILRRLGVPLDALPSLTGAADQERRQAGAVRAGMLDDIVTEYQRFREQLDEQQGNGMIERPEVIRRQEWCDRCVLSVVMQINARWWIDRQAQAGWALVQRAARTSR